MIVSSFALHEMDYELMVTALKEMLRVLKKPLDRLAPGSTTRITPRFGIPPGPGNGDEDEEDHDEDELSDM